MWTIEYVLQLRNSQIARMSLNLKRNLVNKSLGCCCWWKMRLREKDSTNNSKSSTTSWWCFFLIIWQHQQHWIFKKQRRSQAHTKNNNNNTIDPDETTGVGFFYHCPAPCVGLELSLRQQQRHFSGFFRGCFEADLRGKKQHSHSSSSNSITAFLVTLYYDRVSLLKITEKSQVSETLHNSSKYLIWFEVKMTKRDPKSAELRWTIKRCESREKKIARKLAWSYIQCLIGCVSPCGFFYFSADKCKK